MGQVLSQLEIDILRALRRKQKLEDLAGHSGVPAPALGKAIATLQINGYLGDDGQVTPKGLRAIGE